MLPTLSCLATAANTCDHQKRNNEQESERQTEEWQGQNDGPYSPAEPAIGTCSGGRADNHGNKGEDRQTHDTRNQVSQNSIEPAGGLWSLTGHSSRIRGVDLSDRIR